jgi:hypothetical protein
VFLHAFDLLELDGEDWRPSPLEERKAKLQQLITTATAGIRYSEHLDGDGATIFAHACKLGLDHLEASGVPLSDRTEQNLAQGQEPPGAGGAAVQGRRAVSD